MILFFAPHPNTIFKVICRLKGIRIIRTGDRVSLMVEFHDTFEKILILFSPLNTFEERIFNNVNN